MSHVCFIIDSDYQKDFGLGNQSDVTVSSESISKTDTEMHKCRAFEVIQLSEQGITTLTDNPAYCEVGVSNIKF